MKKIRYILPVVVILAACDALDQDPSTSVTVDTAITSVEDLSNAVNGAYYVATYGTTMTVASELSIYADLVGPDSYQPASSGQNASRLAQYALTPADTYNAYYYLYAALACVNNALDKAAGLEDQEAAAPYVAELYAMRGLFHFHLATVFAPIPTSDNANDMGVVLADKVFDINYIGERATLQQTYAMIIEDFTKAIDTGLNQQRSTGHMNYWAALALRARANLYFGNYKAALADAQQVIEESPYGLYTIDNYTKAWSVEGADEVIMEYLQTDVYNAQRFAPGYYTSPLGYSEYGVSPEFYEWLQQNPADVRSQMVADYNVAPDPNFNPGFYPLKYPGNAGASVRTYTSNIRVIRLSEIYLIAAEAALNEGEEPAPYINALRANRIEGYMPVDEVIMDDIIDERRKELFAEGQIAFDYWRTGRTVVNGSFTIESSDYRTVLPIPVEEVDMSGGRIKQNPGYGS